MSVEIKGLDSLFNKLNGLDSGLRNTIVATAIDKGCIVIQKSAKSKCPFDEGALKNSIDRTVKQNGNNIEGAVFTNMEYAPYVEFGTGPIGEANRPDLPAEVSSKISYRSDGWYISSEDIDERTAEKYHFKRVEFDGKVFYYTKGAKPHPFLYPAVHENEKLIEDTIKASLKNSIDRLAGGG